jgi:(S)-2-hydroxy-acid oxidase
MAVEPVCIDDIAAIARQKLDRNAYNYYVSGADGEQTLTDNVEAFKRYRFRPRFLRDVSKIDTATSILGETISFPVCVAPTAMHRMAHPEGEAATARACIKYNTCMTLSSWSTVRIEDVAKRSGDGLRWFQLYVYKDRALTASLVKRAEAAGYKAIAVTIDTPIVGKRLNDNRFGFDLPSHLTLANFDMESTGSLLSEERAKKGTGSALQRYTQRMTDTSLSWKDITWLMSITSLPVVVKGVLTAEDARIAVELGVKGILVSNHGARQLDGVPATIEVLKEIVDAVCGKCEVYLDGGVRRGTDVLKALALGARAVFIGRPVLWGLAYKGQEGVEKVLQLLKDEFSLAMMLSGCTSVSSITKELVVKESHFHSKL